MPLATQHGFDVLQGHCFEQDRTFPYAPLIDLLRSGAAARSADELARDFGDAAPELIKLLPDLAWRIDGLSPSPLLNPEQEKQRLFHTLTGLFVRLAATQPLLVVVEDLHWSDDTSLEFLLYLARRLTAQPILLLFTYRTHEVSPSLTHFLAILDREHVAVEMELTHLAREDVDAMVRAIFEMAQPTTSEFLDSFYGLTEGNPFYVEEVLKALLASGEIYFEHGEWTRKPMHEFRTPRSVQDAVARRTSRLSLYAGQIMTLAAVAGRRFDFGLLQRLTGCDEQTLLHSIKEMIAAQLVVEESAERFAFRHALTREAVYSELLERERMTLHGRIAATMEDLHADSLDAYIGSLSYHYYEAGSWKEALAYASVAGDQAQALYAHAEARQRYERARVCAEKLHLAERLAEIDEAIGDVGFAGGEYLLAVAAYARALENTPSAPERCSHQSQIGRSLHNGCRRARGSAIGRRAGRAGS